MQQQTVISALMPIWKYTFRCFHIRITNIRRQGRRGMQTVEADGVQFPSGHVVIDTDDLPRKGYASMDDLLESLAQYGPVDVEEVGEVNCS